MNVTLSIPDTVAASLTATGKDLALTAYEALIAQAYRESRMSRAEVQDALGYSWHETEAFLARHGCERHYGETEFESDRKSLGELLGE